MSEYTNLIICCAGDKSLHINWVALNSSYDIMVIYYGTDTKIAEKYKANSTYFFQQKGYKFELLRNIVAPLYDTGALKQYKYIWLPDEDLEISSEQLERMFILADERDVDIWQPSIANYLACARFPASKKWYSWAGTEVQNGGIGYRRINYPEVMMPGFSAWAFRHIFLVSLKLFPKANVGWALHGVWDTLSKHYHSNGFVKNYIFDDIQVYHTIPVNFGSMMHTIGNAEYKLYQGNFTLDDFKTCSIAEALP